jgi:glycerol-3-phosphate dehydrogenase (NAD(P)+)
VIGCNRSDGSVSTATYISGVQVTVLGAGSWGTTTAALLASRHPTVLWARRAETAAEIDGSHTNEAYLEGFELPEKLRATDDLEKAVRHAELLLVGVPSSAMRTTIRCARQWIHPWIPIVSLAKGLEQKALLRMSQVIGEEAPGHPVAALTGPNIALEFIAGQAAASVIATEDLSVAATIQRVLTRGLFRVTPTMTSWAASSVARSRTWSPSRAASPRVWASVTTPAPQ